MGSIDFAVKELLTVSKFMQKSEFRAEVLKVTKIDIERERRLKTDGG